MATAPITNPAYGKQWTKDDLAIIAESRITPNDMARWARGNAPDTDAMEVNADIPSMPGMDIEVVSVKTQYVLLWRNDTYVPRFVKAVGTANVPSLSVYGRSETGESVCAHVWNMHPYFVVRATQKLTGAKLQSAAHAIGERLEALLDRDRKFSRADWRAEQGEGGEDGRGWRQDPGPSVISVEPIMRISATDCLARKWPFFKITVRTPNQIVAARDFFQKAREAVVHIDGYAIDRITYESNVVFENRFMIDRDIIGGGWAHLNAPPDQHRAPHDKESTCDIELDVDYRDVQGYSMADDAAGRFNRPSTQRVCSYDLECAAPAGQFPDAERDPIIQIGVDYWTVSNPHATERLMFMMGSSTPIKGARVMCYATEREMLNAFGRFLETYDPDVITGYNILGFDNPYLHTRAKLTGAMQLLLSTRNSGAEVRSRESRRESRNTGNSQYTEVTWEGRVCYDMLPFVRENAKLRSYTLNAVSRHFLGDQKEDMAYENILPLYMGSPEDRRKLAVYCIKDASLPKLLAHKLLPIQQMIEFARVTGVQQHQVQGQGSSIKVMTAVLRACRKRNVIMPYEPNQPKREYQGALVAEPTPDFYVEKPASVLDFFSLYPSIMIAHNLSFDTYVPPDLVHLFDEDDVETCPEGHTYIKRSVRTGILTEVLENLLALRGAAKKLMFEAAKTGNLNLKAVYNCRQLAIKVLANSVYGWTSLSTSVYFWYCGESCTSYGRVQITLTKDKVEEKFTIANGYPADADCIYGDTDSVMVSFGIVIESPTRMNGNVPAVATPEEMLVPCSNTACHGGTLAKCPLKECNFGKKASPATLAAIAKTIELSHEAAVYCTTFFAAPNKLEFENVYWPYLLLDRKKRYAGPFWENALKPSYTKIRGLESERRDNCPLASEAQRSCLNAILYELDPQKAVDHVKQTIRDLRTGEADLGKLIISNRLKLRQNDMTAAERRRWKAKGGTAYKDECEARGVYNGMMTHAELDRTMARRTGKGYNIGDRVPYVIVDRALAKKDDKVYLKAEDPIYALKHDLRMDREYYTRQIVACTVNVLAPVYEHRLEGKELVQSKLAVTATAAVAPAPKRTRPPSPETNPRPTKVSRQRGIGSYFNAVSTAADDETTSLYVPEVAPKNRSTAVRVKAHAKIQAFGWRTKSMLLHGDHMLKLNLRREIVMDGESSAMDGYVTTKCQCIGCGAATSRNVYICAQCRPRHAELTEKHFARHAELRTKCKDVWETCHRCQINNQKEYLGAEETARALMELSLTEGEETAGLSECNATGCENFFRRTTTTRDRDRVSKITEALRALEM